MIRVCAATETHSFFPQRRSYPAAAFATPKTYPVANLATPKGIADGIESGQGESKPLSEKAPPKVMTTPTSRNVENESSGDAHPVASETSIEPKLKECVEEIIQITQANNGALPQGDSPHSGIEESSTWSKQRRYTSCCSSCNAEYISYCKFGHV